jgi:HPt (histidine-containing phosphotransfer) domain-containing protein
LLLQNVKPQVEQARSGEQAQLLDCCAAERLMHNVKGVAGNIGAHAVQNAAAHLEKAIKSSAPEAEIEALGLSLGQCPAPSSRDCRRHWKGRTANLLRFKQAIGQRSSSCRTNLAESDGAVID